MRKMSIPEAISILDPDTSSKTLAEIRYYGGFNGKRKVQEKILDACETACEVMREFEAMRNKSCEDAR